MVALHQHSAPGLARLLARGAVSAVEVMRAFQARIAALNPRHNAIISQVAPDVALAAARASDRRRKAGTLLGPLDGLPIAFKDTTPTKGLRTTWGSPLFRDHVPAADSIAAGRVRAAGAIPVGKTNVPEFGLGSHSYNQVFGVTRNAWNPALSAGGSSGGAAVAMALRLVPLADGSDMGGSLRNPAAWNNLFGFRPSQGRVPFFPTEDVYSSQLGTEGPMGRTVEELMFLLAVQAGRDLRAPQSLDGDGGLSLAALPAQPGRSEGLRDLRDARLVVHRRQSGARRGGPAGAGDAALGLLGRDAPARAGVDAGCPGFHGPSGRLEPRSGARGGPAPPLRERCAPARSRHGLQQSAPARGSVRHRSDRDVALKGDAMHQAAKAVIVVDRVVLDAAVVPEGQ
jgi:Asp-tRNA(Asn)/Glu-tRNA(Gln) amidotransferase A subunit family amidase